MIMAELSPTQANESVYQYRSYWLLQGLKAPADFMKKHPVLSITTLIALIVYFNGIGNTISSLIHTVLILQPLVLTLRAIAEKQGLGANQPLSGLLTISNSANQSNRHHNANSTTTTTTTNNNNNRVNSLKLLKFWFTYATTILLTLACQPVVSFISYQYSYLATLFTITRNVFFTALLIAPLRVAPVIFDVLFSPLLANTKRLATVENAVTIVPVKFLQRLISRSFKNAIRFIKENVLDVTVQEDLIAGVHTAPYMMHHDKHDRYEKAMKNQNNQNNHNDSYQNENIRDITPNISTTRQEPAVMVQDKDDREAIESIVQDLISPHTVFGDSHLTPSQPPPSPPQHYLKLSEDSEDDSDDIHDNTTDVIKVKDDNILDLSSSQHKHHRHDGLPAQSAKDKVSIAQMQNFPIKRNDSLYHFDDLLRESQGEEGQDGQGVLVPESKQQSIAEEQTDEESEEEVLDPIFQQHQEEAEKSIQRQEQQQQQKEEKQEQQEEKQEEQHQIQPQLKLSKQHDALPTPTARKPDLEEAQSPEPDFQPQQEPQEQQAPQQAPPQQQEDIPQNDQEQPAPQEHAQQNDQEHIQQKDHEQQQKDQDQQQQQLQQQQQNNNYRKNQPKQKPQKLTKTVVAKKPTPPMQKTKHPITITTAVGKTHDQKHPIHLNEDEEKYDEMARPRISIHKDNDE